MATHTNSQPAEKSAEWKHTWRSRIGGGRSAAAAGIHEYLTPTELYFSMVHGIDRDLENNPDVMRGTLLEPVAMQRLQMLYPELEFSPHDQDQFISNPKYPWGSDLPDGWVRFGGAQIPVQIKVPRPRNWERLAESVPLYIQCNCVHSAAMNDSPAILLACLNPTTMEIFRQIYEPQQAAIDSLMGAEEKFWDKHIVPRIPPPAQSHADLKLLWPTPQPGSVVAANAKTIANVLALAKARALEKKYTEKCAEISLRIKKFMRDAEVLAGDRGQVIATWKNSSSTGLDTKRMWLERPELWDEFPLPRTQRTFLLKAANNAFSQKSQPEE